MSSSLFLIFASLLFYFYPHTVVCRDIATSSTLDGKLNTYIINVQPADNINGLDSLENYYRSFLPKTSTDSGESRLIYSYSEVFSGFAARLTEQEVAEMAKKEGFVRALPDKIIPLLTTHTPAFLGLNLGSRGSFWNSSNFGKGVIIGLLDTGITPDHPSFSDEGLSSPPSKWKGSCALKSGCNNKIIGARTYGTSSETPLEDEGHGTHTASTAAGNTVPNVNAFGLRSGTMSGIAPKAHLAIYKVCTADGCTSSDVLAGLDDAVKDGVDVISLSLGGSSTPYDYDPIAVGSFGAIEKGIVVVCAGGNSGPTPSTVSNDAPWILTVAASSVDRSFRATMKLGDKNEFHGESLLQPANFSSDSLPLVYPGDESSCDNFDGVDVKGKIVICTGGSISQKAQAVKAAGGVGIILGNYNYAGCSILVPAVPFPVLAVSYADVRKIISYASSGHSPTTSIAFNGTVLRTSPAPTIAFFSSRGPSQQSSGILKPDITAPGLNILAAWNSVVDSSKEKYGFNIISGTSMATPHVSGIAALLKNLHPNWSPAAIKSAIVTTSDADDRDRNPIEDENHKAASFYSKGAGHVNTPKAAEPGLIYDLDVDDYVRFFCGLGLGDSGLGAITRRSNASCSGVKNITQADLNYPSITVSIKSTPVTVSRTVTNVGAANAKYSVEVGVPKGVSVTVKPQTLQFSNVNEKQTFTVTVSSTGVSAAEGNLKWISGKVAVRSPLVILPATSSV